MKVAVVGGGLFGCTIAIHLARAGHDVTLFEERADIMECASAVNQFRLHRGYHYPRSPETIVECRDSAESFRREYGDAVRATSWPFYAIMAEGSRTGPVEYLATLERHNLRHHVYERVDGLFDPASITALIRAWEDRIDYGVLVGLIATRLRENGVAIRCGHRGSQKELSGFSRIVVAAYAGLNDVMGELGIATQAYQFEVVEKPLVRLPAEWRGHRGSTGVVILDGERGCSVDEYGNSGLHLLGHVEHAVWARNIGDRPAIPHRLREMLHQGVVARPKLTRFEDMITAAAEFMPLLAMAEHVGSMFTVRAVLAGVDDTDERPTMVEDLDGRVIRVFSGKLGTCVQAAQQVTGIINADRGDVSLVGQTPATELQLHRRSRSHPAAHGGAQSDAAA